METLSNLQFGYHEYRFLARIMNKWEGLSNSSYYTPVINFILIDVEHNLHWALAPFSQKDRLETMVFPGMLYHINNFKIIAAHGPFKPIDTNITLVFGNDTQWHDYVFRTSIPRCNFNLCSWPKLLTRANNNNLLSDVAGVIICVQDIKYKQNDVQRLKLTLIDKSLIQIRVALWDTKARAFQRDIKDHRQKNTVAVITGLLVKSRKGKIYLSSTSATSMYFNPHFEPIRYLAENISAAYGDFICCNPQQIEHKYQVLPQDSITTPCFTLQQLSGIRLWLYQKYQCNVTITNIQLRDCHHDESCLRCKDSVIVDKHRYSCATCGRNFITPPGRPEIVLGVVDHTGQTKFTIQPPELRQLTGYSRNQILKERKLVNGKWTFPAALEIVKGANCTFEVMLAPSSYSNTTGKLFVDSVIRYAKIRNTETN